MHARPLPPPLSTTHIHNTFKCVRLEFNRSFTPSISPSATIRSSADLHSDVRLSEATNPAPTKRVRERERALPHAEASIGTSNSMAPARYPVAPSATTSAAATAPFTCALSDNPILSVDALAGFEMRCGVGGGTCCAVTATRRIIQRIVADALAHMRHADAAAVCRQFLSFLSGVLGTAELAPPEGGGGGGRGGGGGAAAASAAPAGMPLDLDSITDGIVPKSTEGDMHTAVVIQATVDVVVQCLRDATPSEVRTPGWRCGGKAGGGSRMCGLDGDAMVGRGVK